MKKSDSRVTGFGSVDRLAGEVSARFLDPFRADPDLVLAMSATQRDRYRRATLLRLVLACAIAVAVVGTLPVTMMRPAPPQLPLAAVAGVLLSLACLLLNRAGHTDIAGALFICGCLLAAIAYIFLTPSDPHKPETLVYAAMTILILIAGMVLPSWSVWPVAALVFAATITGSLLAPTGSTGDGSVRGASVGVFVALQLLTAILSWFAARSAITGIHAAIRAFEREHELAALKDQFIIDANHELRTPIMALYGNVEMLSALGEGGTPEVRERLLDRALDSGEAVLRLLNSVLDASAMTNRAPRLRIAPVTIAPLLRDVLETFDPRDMDEPGFEDTAMGGRTVRLEAAEDLVALADEDRVRQVLVNLLSNALKYSPPGSPLRISAVGLPAQRHGHLFVLGAADERQDAAGYVQIGVRDFGYGVPPRDAAKLFNRFVRLERDIAGPVRGTGVGLYICRLLVEAMGGRIWVESTGMLGDGSTFAFTLPATVLATDASPTEEGTPSDNLIPAYFPIAERAE